VLRAGVGSGVGVGVGVGVDALVAVGAEVGDAVGVTVGEAAVVGVEVGVVVAVWAGVAVAVWVGVAVAVWVGVAVAASPTDSPLLPDASVEECRAAPAVPVEKRCVGPAMTSRAQESSRTSAPAPRHPTSSGARLRSLRVGAGPPVELAGRTVRLEGARGSLESALFAGDDTDTTRGWLTAPSGGSDEESGRVVTVIAGVGGWSKASSDHAASGAINAPP
jgi:hypothetical protein